ncbi:hypothetical protein BZG02_06245 [Labilibaculum filiforme]|uniref:Polysaccharide polymerase n=1 Tax=Labilibaculum filiforme TaxID=1940526 RepID=A0A2N3I285_9BACT|nr:hypothetical protein BZG02_06245 [Labilibaculum filiforme]
MRGKIKKPNIKLLLDSFIVFLNISNSYSIIPYLLFFQYYRAINTSIIILINIIYIIYRFGRKGVFNLKDTLFLCFIVINVLNYIFGLVTNTFGIGMFPFLFANMTFYILLYNLFRKYIEVFTFDRSFWLIIRGYIWLSTISILSVLTLFILITYFNVQPHVNDIGSSMDLFRSNLRDPRDTYYFPLGISVLFDTTGIRVPYLQQYGIITGLFHEPHSFTFLVIPSFFLIYRYLKNSVLKLMIFTVYVVVMLIEASTTNILAFLLCLSVYFFVKYRKNFFLLSLIFGVFISVFLLIDPVLYNFIVNKLSSGSATYSQSTILFAFEPKTLIGTNFFNLGYLKTYWNEPDPSMNVGFINFFINLFFLSIFVYRIIVLNLRRSIETRYVGLFVLYFFLHSMKVTMVTYSLSYLLFVMFLIRIFYFRKYYLDTKTVII